MSKYIINKFKDTESWITQKEAACLRGVSPSAISRLLHQGRLRNKVIAGRRLVYREDVLNFKPLVQGVGRPSKSMSKIAATKVNREEWITLKEAAALRQVTVSGIKTAITNGRLRTLKKEGIPFVCKKDVLNYRPRTDYHPDQPLEVPLPPGENLKDWISVAEAARIRGIGEATITTHATRKRIRSIKWGDTRLVHRRDILNFKRKPRTTHPKKK